MAFKINNYEKKVKIYNPLTGESRLNHLKTIFEFQFEISNIKKLSNSLNKYIDFYLLQANFHFTIIFSFHFVTVLKISMFENPNNFLK